MVDLQVNIAEALTITVTDPTTWADGSLINTNPTTNKLESDFLRNKVNVTAKSNNPYGVTVSMYTKDATDLRNTTSYSAGDPTSYIPTLSSNSTVSAFPTNYWGYSRTHDPDGNGDTTAGATTAVYKPLSTSAIQLFTTIGSGSNSGQEDVFFGAKADETKQSGTYTRTVYFAAVTGTINNDPSDPGYNPAIPDNPTETEPINDVAHFSPTPTNQTSYTTRSTTGSGTSSVTGSMDVTTDDVTKGNVTDTYAKAYGVTSSSENNNGTAVATALTVAAGVSALSGIAFFLAAKRKKDDDEEEGN